MKKRILILGAGIYQMPLICKTKDMGLEVLVASIPGPYPGFDIADIPLEINTTDLESILRVSQEYQIAGILTTGTDVCLPTLGYVAEKLHLKGPSYDACITAQNKILMKQCFKRNGVPTAPFDFFADCDSGMAFAQKIGYPVMVKAPDLSGSRGITKVNTNDEFLMAWKRAVSCSRSSEIIVEKFISGVEFGGHVIMLGNKIHNIVLHNTTTSPYPYSAPIGHSVPSCFSESEQAAALDALGKAAVALSLRDCIANADVIMSDGKPYIVEMTARMGGTCLPENLTYCYKQNLYEFMISQAMGDSCQYSHSPQIPNAVLLLRSDKDGILQNIDVPSEIKKDEDFLEMRLDLKPGDAVHSFKTGPDRLGHIMAKGLSALEAEQSCLKFSNSIHFSIL